jgi:DNA-binding SARP family transcriptional activator
MGLAAAVECRPDIRAELVVQVVGGLAVFRGGGEVPAAEVGSRKGRTLFGFLAVHPGFVPADRMTEVVWGDAPPQTPVANIATLVSRLRSALGPSAIAGGPSGYRLGDHVRVDLHEARALIVDAEHRADEPALMLRAAACAVDLLERGPVLTDQGDSSWVEQARATQGQLLRRARHATAEAALRVGDLRTARSIAEDATCDDAFDETAWRLLMRADYAAGEPARALIAYRNLRATLATELGIDPAPATRDLHAAILRGAEY